MSKDKDFRFYMPAELIKGENDDAPWRVKGIASTPDQDLQGETVDQDGLDISALKAGRGLFNWDHQKGPENILGQIEDAAFVKSDGKQVLEVDGYLFKNQDRAKAFHNILTSIKKGNGPRVHMSIEGKIIERDFQDQKKIKKARIDKVALTLDPVNPYTYAELVKSLNAPQEEQESENIEISETFTLTKSELDEIITQAVTKALSAGAGYASAPSSRTGGEAMSTESMDKKPKCVTYEEKKKKSNKEMVKSVLSSLKTAHPDHDPLELAEWAIEAFLNKTNKESQRD